MHSRTAFCGIIQMTNLREGRAVILATWNRLTTTNASLSAHSGSSQANNSHAVSATGFWQTFVLQHCLVSWSVCPRSHNSLPTHRMVLTVCTQVTCLLVKYKRVVGTRQSLDFIRKQTFGYTLTCVSLTGSLWKTDKWPIIYKCAVPTTWRVSTSGKCLSNTPIVTAAA